MDNKIILTLIQAEILRITEEIKDNCIKLFNVTVVATYT